jgi:DNA mismatch repair protein MutS
VHYLKNELRRSLSHLTRLTVYRNSQFMVLDAATQANLELVQARGGGRDTSLLGALDRTVTPMGARKLRDWILHPLCDLGELRARQQLIGELLGRSVSAWQSARNAQVDPRSRTHCRALTQTGGNARDLLVLRTGLEVIPISALISKRCIVAQASQPRDPHARRLRSLPRRSLRTCTRCHTRRAADRAIVDEPPALTREGGMFRDGYFAALDELRAASREGKDWIAQLQQRAIEETGIKSLKVRYTSVFGYFIEVTKSNLGAVPPPGTANKPWPTASASSRRS